MPSLKLTIDTQYLNNRGDVVTIVSCHVDTKTGGGIYTCDAGIRYTQNGRALPPATILDSVVALRYPKLKRAPRK